MNEKDILELALKNGLPLVLIGYIVIKGMRIAEGMAKSLSTMNREMGEIKKTLEISLPTLKRKKWQK